MAYSLVANTTKAGGATGGTTPAIDTTGADLLVAAFAFYTGSGSSGPPVLTDSKSNTWTQIGTDQASGSDSKLALYYVASPTVGSGHTFTLGGGVIAPSLEIQAWSGSAASPLDQTSQAQATQPGSVTPSQDNELLVTAVAPIDTASASAVNLSFTISDNNSWASGNNDAGAAAYLVQTTAAAKNPTWTVSSGTPATIIATFKAGGAATSYSFPTAGWVWNHQAPTLAFANATSQKGWVWSPRGPTQGFTIAAQQKAWAWNHQAPLVTLTIAGVQKAWAWAAGAPVLGFLTASAQRAWRWAGNAPTITGGNMVVLGRLALSIGAFWRRRRSRPSL